MGKARDTRVVSLAKGVDNASGTVKYRFSVEGARQISVSARAATGTPTVTMNYYVHGDTTAATAANMKITETTGTSTLAARGYVNLIAADTSANTNFGCPIPATEAEVQIAGAFTGLNLVVILGW